MRLPVLRARARSPDTYPAHRVLLVRIAHPCASLPRPRQHSALTLPLVPAPSLAPGEYEYYDDDVDDETGSETPARKEALLAQFSAHPKTTT